MSRHNRIRDSNESACIGSCPEKKNPHKDLDTCCTCTIIFLILINAKPPPIHTFPLRYAITSQLHCALYRHSFCSSTQTTNYGLGTTSNCWLAKHGRREHGGVIQPSLPLRPIRFVSPTHSGFGLDFRITSDLALAMHYLQSCRADGTCTIPQWPATAPD